ncbi:MAG: phosphotransferase [Motilibacteraceae bacterium]
MTTQGPASDRDGLLALAVEWAGRRRPPVRLQRPTARWNDDGWDFAVLHVDDVDGAGWTFRFPRRADVAARHEAELRLRPLLAPRLPVPLPGAAPRDLVVGLLPDGISRFAGHRTLPGVPLDETALLGNGLLASQLVGLLVALHRQPARETVQVGIPEQTPAGWRDHHRALVEQVAAAAPEAALAPGGQRALDRLRRDLDDDALWPDRLVLCHGDVGPPHLLVDPARGVLSGVIDWTDARLGDPALDLAGVLAGCGEEPYALVRDLYLDAADTLHGPWGSAHVPRRSAPDVPKDRVQDGHLLDARVRFHVALGPVHTAAHGLATDDEEWLRLGVRALGAGA